MFGEIKRSSENLLLFGLVLLPFYELIIYLLMPNGKIPDWIDLRITKEYISIGLALTLTACAWAEAKRISCPNKWALFFLIFMFFNLSKSPIGFVQPVVDLSLLGSYTAEFKVFSFFLMFCSLASCQFSKETIDRILTVMFIGALLMSVYMILQALNLDQIFKPKPEYFASDVKGIRVGGFFGQPTLAVPFLAMSVPIAVYFKKYLAIVLLSVALILTKSDFAFASIALIALLYSIKTKRFIPLFIVASIAGAALLLLHPHKYFSGNGRFEVWVMILKDVFSGEMNGVPVRIGLFGAGLNNFGKVFTALHASAYTRAHNEFLQVLWCCGVVGEAIFLMIHYNVAKTALSIMKNPAVRTLSISLAVAIFCAMGTFVYQLGVYQFYIVAMAALIYQMKERVTA